MFSRPMRLGRHLEFGKFLLAEHPLGIFLRVLILQLSVATGSRPGLDYLMERIFADYELGRWVRRIWYRLQGKVYRNI